MIKRTILLGAPMYVRTELNQLVIERDESVAARRPIEDIGYVVVEHPQVRFSTPALQQLAASNTVVVFCGRDHMPNALLLPMDQHYTAGAHTRAQAEASRPLRKQLWKQTVKAKLRNQAHVLRRVGAPSGAALERIARRVRSGDPDNAEAEGARRYWSQVFSEFEELSGFTRDRYGEMPNALLNYGYSILRSATSRALVGAGLHPAFGIHHRNKYNAFCLADDLMEPYRPFVDEIVLELLRDGLVREENGLTMACKQALLQVTMLQVSSGERSGSLMVALQRSAWSLAACYMGDKKRIVYPKVANEEEGA